MSKETAAMYAKLDVLDGINATENAELLTFLGEVKDEAQRIVDVATTGGIVSEDHARRLLAKVEAAIAKRQNTLNAGEMERVLAAKPNSQA